MNIGIAGAGTIIPDFLKAQMLIEELNVKAICATSNGKDRMAAFAAEYKIPDIYTDYQEMLRDDSLNVIYIAVPNHLHYSFSKQALEQGKSVICEKPFCSNLTEAKELAALADARKLFLFEAISNQYFPNYLEVKKLLKDLGDIKIVEMNFSQYSRRYDAFKQGQILPVFDPKKSGGALMDLNVYNVHFITGLFGEPQEVHYYPNMERGIDTSGILVLRYPGFLCTSIAAKDCKAPLCINIQGDKGYIHSDSPANAFQEFQFFTNDGANRSYALNAVKERLYYELRAFADMVERNDRQQHRQQLLHSLMVQKILDTARKFS